MLGGMAAAAVIRRPGRNPGGIPLIADLGGRSRKRCSERAEELDLGAARAQFTGTLP